MNTRHRLISLLLLIALMAVGLVTGCSGSAGASSEKLTSVSAEYDLTIPRTLIDAVLAEPDMGVLGLFLPKLDKGEDLVVTTKLYMSDKIVHAIAKLGEEKYGLQMDLTSQKLAMYTLFGNKKGITISLTEMMKGADADVPKMPESLMDALQNKETVNKALQGEGVKKLGVETIDGKPCDVYEIGSSAVEEKVPDMGQAPEFTMKLWMWQEYNLPLRLELSVPGASLADLPIPGLKGGLQITVVAKNVKTNQVKEADLALPKDIDFVDVTNLLTQTLPELENMGITVPGGI